MRVNICFRCLGRWNSVRWMYYCFDRWLVQARRNYPKNGKSSVQRESFNTILSCNKLRKYTQSFSFSSKTVAQSFGTFVLLCLKTLSHSTWQWRSWKDRRWQRGFNHSYIWSVLLPVDLTTCNSRMRYIRSSIFVCEYISVTFVTMCSRLK